nr:MAG TPA: hypothetical protein [Caudoviricetes sp.]
MAGTGFLRPHPSSFLMHCKDTTLFVTTKKK